MLVTRSYHWYKTNCKSCFQFCCMFNWLLRHQLQIAFIYLWRFAWAGSKGPSWLLQVPVWKIPHPVSRQTICLPMGLCPHILHKETCRFTQAKASKFPCSIFSCGSSFPYIFLSLLDSFFLIVALMMPVNLSTIWHHKQYQTAFSYVSYRFLLYPSTNSSHY